MNTKNLLLLAAAGFFLLAPVAHLQLAADDNMPMMGQVKVLSDADLTAAIKKAISSNPAFSALKINVAVDQGVVTLSGKVDSAKAKMDIESLVKGVVGVSSVINNIEVAS